MKGFRNTLEACCTTVDQFSASLPEAALFFQQQYLPEHLCISPSWQSCCLPYEDFFEGIDQLLHRIYWKLKDFHRLKLSYQSINLCSLLITYNLVLFPPNISCVGSSHGGRKYGTFLISEVPGTGMCLSEIRDISNYNNWGARNTHFFASYRTFLSCLMPEIGALVESFVETEEKWSKLKFKVLKVNQQTISQKCYKEKDCVFEVKTKF